MKKGLLLLLPLTLVMGCGEDEEAGGSGAVGSGPKEDTAEATARYIIDGMKKGQPVVVWNALPEKYQSDVNGLVRSVGEGMDPAVWKQVMGIVENVHKLLNEKQQFIVNHPAVTASDDPEGAKEAFTHVTGLLKTLLDGVGDVEKLKQFDGAKFMTTSGAELVTQFDALAKLGQGMAPPGAVGDSPGVTGLAALDNVTIETVTESDSTATLKFVHDGKEEFEDFVKVDGKWLPKEMTVDWDKKVAEAKAEIAKLPEKMGEMRMGIGMASGMLAGILTPLQSAENQEQFNEAVEGLKASAGGLMGMGLGGGPPGGGFGGPGGPGGFDSPGGPPEKTQELSPGPADPNE